jgi:hypothetical protein
MEVKDLLLFAVPSITLAVLLVIVLAERVLRASRDAQKYELDRFRQDLERRITELSQQMTMSEERFRRVNHLLLDAQSANRTLTTESTPGEFLRRLGVESQSKIDRKLIFVLMPFNSDFQEVYDAIRATVEDLGLRCSRGDETLVSGNILAHILREATEARLIIADITGRNPNVFYELGILHAIGKPVLMVAQSPSDIPFDVSSIRVLIYKDARDLFEKLRKWLAQALADQV